MKLASAMRDLSAAQPGFLPIVQGIKAPVSRAAKAIDKRGVVIAITKDGTMYSQGFLLPDLPYAGEYLEDLSRKAHEAVGLAGEPRESSSLPLYIWADRATPVKAIMGLAALADNPMILLERRHKAAKGKANGNASAVDDDPPPPEEDESGGTGTQMALDENQKAAREAAIQAAKDAGLLGEASKRLPAFYVRLIVTNADGVGPINGGISTKLPPREPESTKFVVDILKSAIGTCAPVMTALGTSGLAGTPEKEVAKLVAEVPAGLTSCQCKVANADDLMTGMRLWFGGWAPSLQWIELPTKLKATDKKPIGTYVK